MNVVLANNEKKIAEAMRGLCDAIGNLAQVRDAMDESLKLLPPGDEAEGLAMKLNRAVSRLTQASTDVPDELWKILVNDNQAGGSELVVRFINVMKVQEEKEVA